MTFLNGIISQRSNPNYQKLKLHKVEQETMSLETLFNGLRTIEFDIKLNSNVSSDDTFIERNVSTNDKYFVAFNSGNVLKAMVNNGSGNKFVYSANGLVVGTWYTVALRLDPTDGLRFFINGVAQASSNTPNTALSTSTVKAFLGGFESLGIRHMDVSTKMVKLWSSSRTSTQLLQGIGVVPSPTTSGLIECFPLLDEQGLTVTGIKGNTVIISTNNAGQATYVNSTMRLPA